VSKIDELVKWIDNNAQTWFHGYSLVILTIAWTLMYSSLEWTPEDNTGSIKLDTVWGERNNGAMIQESLPENFIKPIMVGYLVQPGDSLYAICATLETDCDRLIDINNLQPPYTLYVGQRLEYETPPTYSQG